MATSLALAESITISGTTIHRDANGRYCLNDLHKAAMANGKATESHRPGNFLKSPGVEAFVRELGTATGIAVVEVVNGGKHRGTYAVELVVMRYAAWIDPEFEVKVYQTFQAVAHNQMEEFKRGWQAAQDRNESRLEFFPMMEALIASRALDGKECKPHHFSNEADCLNRITLGMTAAKFRVHHDIDTKLPLRDYLTPAQIACIKDLQRANMVMLQMGETFEHRKDRLGVLFSRQHAAKLTAEVLRLSA